MRDFSPSSAKSRVFIAGLHLEVAGKIGRHRISLIVIPLVKILEYISYSKDKC